MEYSIRPPPARQALTPHGFIAAIEYYLPEKILTTDGLAAAFPEWPIKKIDAKTGIWTRHIVDDEECASDLAVKAAAKLFSLGICGPKDIDFLLFCTQSPDYVLPTTACLLQDRLGLSMTAGALDFNLGCSGFVYGLGLAESLIASGQARTVLLITAETYSKYLDPRDKGCRTIFGDGAAATLIISDQCDSPLIGPFVYGTDGSGGNSLIIRNSGTRRVTVSPQTPESDIGHKRGKFLSMDGLKIFDFAIRVVPQCVQDLLEKAALTEHDIDLFVFHQANAYLLEELRNIIGISREKFQVAIRDSANTTSSTIPIALKQAEYDGRLKQGACVMLVGYGVGYSWAGTLVRWSARHAMQPSGIQHCCPKLLKTE